MSKIYAIPLALLLSSQLFATQEQNTQEKSLLQSAKELYDKNVKEAKEFYDTYLEDKVSEGIQKGKELYDKHLKEDVEKGVQKGKEIYEENVKK